MMRQGSFSLQGIRSALAKSRQLVLWITIVITFQGIGGPEVLYARQVAVQQAAQKRAAVLLSVGVPFEKLPPPPPSRLAEAGRWMEAELGAALGKIKGWATAAQSWAPSWTWKWKWNAAPGTTAAAPSRPFGKGGMPPPESVDGREHGPARSLRLRTTRAAEAGATGLDESSLPLRRVERRARIQEIGALAPSLEHSSAIAPPTATPRRIAAEAAPAPEIAALAESLGRSPGRIFRFVHDTIDYEPQWGADAPPLGTLWEGRGTSWEQAWLLQDLLVAAGVDARLEWGEVEISPAMLQDLTGVEDLFRAGDLLTTGGIAVVLQVQAGHVVAARLPHVWVKAWLDYAPNRGATPGTGDTWIRMDPTLKRFDEAYGARVDDAVSFALGPYLQSGTEVTPRATYEQALATYATDQNLGTLEDLKPRRAVTADAFPFVPGTLRARIVSVAGEAQAIPEGMQQRLSVEMLAGDGVSLLTWSAAAPQLWGRRLEIAWPGASASDQATLDLYGGVFATPPYEVDLKPSVRLDGIEVAAGTEIGSAEDVELRATITPPNGVQTFAVWEMFAGEHGVLSLAFGDIPQQVVDRFAQQQATATNFADVEAWGLARAAATYLHALAGDSRHLAALRWHRQAILGAAVLAVQRGAVSTASDGTPVTFAEGPLSIDVGALPLALVPAQGPLVSTVPSLELLGSQGSVREGEALATAFGGEHVTAVGFLTRAVREGQTLTRVDGTNLDAALATAELSVEAEGTIRFGVGQGLIAWIPRAQIEIGGWQTTGYVMENPASGAGAYLVTFERKVPLGETAVEFHAPLDLAEVTAPTEVVATINADNLQSWSLATRPTGEGATTILATGTGPVDNAVLGTFDPTLLLNGLHDLVLTGTTAAGKTVTGRISVVVEGGMKIGNFSLSFVDLAVPLSGLAIEIVRTYDSRARNIAGDFGQGWTLDVRQGSYRNNRKPGEGWQILKGFLPCQQAAETKSHLTTIRLSDREVYRFQPVLTRTGIQGGGCIATVGFRFVDGPVPGATLTILGPDQVFWANGTNSVVDPDSQEVFEPQAVRLTTRDGRVFDLDLGQGVTRLADPNGNALAITAAGITHSSGETVSFVRDSDGRITRISDPSGAELIYAYDGGGDLVSVTDRIGKATQFSYIRDHLLDHIIDARGITPTRNEYDPDGRLVRHVDAFGKEIVYDHQIAERQEIVTDRLGRSRLLAYDERGNVVREVDPLGNERRRTYDSNDNLLSSTDPLGNTTRYTYSGANELLTIADPLGNTTSHMYDAGGRLVTLTDPRGKVTRRRYDGASNLIEILDPEGGKTTSTYDAAGNVLTVTDALNRVTRFTYDGAGNLTRQIDAAGVETIFTYDNNGNRLSEALQRTLSDGSKETLVTTFRYDAEGNLVETIQPGGISTKATHDALGQLIETVDPLGRRTVMTYDALGNEVGTTYPDGTSEARSYDAKGQLVTVTDRGGRVTNYEYDALGRRTKATFPDNSSSISTYDAAGRLIAITDARGNSTSFSYDAAGQRTRVLDALQGVTDLEYDAAGNRTAFTDPNRQTVRFEYDGVGRLVNTTFPNGTTREITYDAAGQKAVEVDQAGRATRFGYDPVGRLLTVTDALSQVTRYSYDELGNRTSESNANGHVTRFEYDALGRKIRRVLPDGASEQFDYDAVGNLTGRTDPLGRTVELSYDSVDRLTQKRLPGGATIAFTYTATGRRATMVDARGTTRYSYDTRDRMVELAYPEGQKLTYGWDANGNRIEVVAHVAGQMLRTQLAYDELDRLETVTDAQGRAYNHTYDANGNRAAITYPSGVHTSYDYDPLNRLTQLNTATSGGAIIDSFRYTLGLTGNRTSVEERDGTVRSYGYDPLYRLTNETVTRAAATLYTKAFVYDPVGNRLQQIHTDAAGTQTTINASYDNRDRQLSRGAQAWTWDTNGNLTEKEAEAVYDWDYEDRLEQVTLADGTILRHIYDADGVRVRAETTPPGGTTMAVDYLVDTSGPLSQVLAETVGGALIAHYVRGDDLLAVLRPGAIAGTWESRFYHADGLGSVRALTEESGTVTDRYAFTAFGELLEHEGDDEQPYLFTGEAFDPNSGFYYNRARWMDPEVGRFVSMDPFEGLANDPPTLHKYLYAKAAPLDYVDPTGLANFQSIGAAMASLGVMITTALQNFQHGIWRAQYVFSNVNAWRWTIQLLRAARTWASGAGIRFQAALEVPLRYSRGRLDVVLRTASRVKQVFIEAKNWNLDTLARQPQHIQAERIQRLAEQAQRYAAPGEMPMDDLIYAFPRVPTTAGGIQIMQEITTRLNALNIQRIAWGVDEFLQHLTQVMH